jgi:VWFA-related protein
MKLADALGGGLVAALVAATAVAQEETRQVPVFRSGVDAVLVDVVVIDGDGKPVPDLAREDFRVLEDGVPQAIATFDVTDWTSYVGERANNGGSGAGGNTYPRRFIFIVNRQGAQFEHIYRAKRDLTSFIVESMAEGDEAMVIDLGYSFKVVQSFQAGKEQTLQTVRKLSQMQIDYPMGPDRAADDIFRNLESLGEALRGLPGRKIVIFFSNELDTFSVPSSRGIDNTFSLKEAVDSLNQANTTVYTIDIRGPQSLTTIQGGLSPLATETGGRYFHNNPTFVPPLRRIGTENQRYYLLSYVSTNPERDGSYRKIEVQVPRDGTTVIARPGYFAREREVESTDDGNEVANDIAKPSPPSELPLAVELSTYLLPGASGKVRVPLSVALPAELLAGSGKAVREVRLSLQDANGRSVHRVAKPVDVQHYYALETVSLTPGSYVLEVTVHEGERELHRASMGLDVPSGLGDRFGVSSILPVASSQIPDGGESIPLLPVSEVRRGEPLHLLFHVLPGANESRSERARVSYRVLDEDGSEMPKSELEQDVALAPLSERPDGTPVVLSVPTSSLSYGSYRVEVRAEDPASGRAAVSELQFRVR